MPPAPGLLGLLHDLLALTMEFAILFLNEGSGWHEPERKLFYWQEGETQERGWRAGRAQEGQAGRGGWKGVAGLGGQRGVGW